MPILNTVPYPIKLSNFLQWGFNVTYLSIRLFQWMIGTVNDDCNNTYV